MPGWRLRERCNSRLHEPAPLCPAACMPGPGRWTAWGRRAQGPLPRAGPRGSGWGRAETLCHQSVHGCGGKWGSALTGASREDWMAENLSDRSPAPSLWGHQKPGRGLSLAIHPVCQGGTWAEACRLGTATCGQGGRGVAIELMATEQLSFWETLRWGGTGEGRERCRGPQLSGSLGRR